MLLPVTPPDVLTPGIAQAAVSWSADATPETEPELSVLPVPASLSAALPKRRLEFLAGRWCARRALETAGCRVPWSGEAGADRAPIWPAGYVGSITHTVGFAWAAAAPRSVWASIGIDSEQRLEPEAACRVADLILGEPETAEAAERALRPPAMAPEVWLTVVFSAKESFYKCLYPLTGCRLNFADVALTACRPEDRVLGLRLRRAAGPQFPAGCELSVRWQIVESRIHTGVALRATLPASPPGSTPG